MAGSCRFLVMGALLAETAAFMPMWHASPARTPMCIKTWNRKGATPAVTRWTSQWQSDKDKSMLLESPLQKKKEEEELILKDVGNNMRNGESSNDASYKHINMFAAELPQITEQIVLQVLGISGLFMFFWGFVWPGSAFVGFSAHDDMIRWMFNTFPLLPSIVPISMLLKYNEVGHLTALTHALPGAIWSVIAPLQLYPQVRAKLGADVHKTAGRIMLAAAAFLMVGYYIIDANELAADVHDFGGKAGTIAAAIDNTHLLPISFNLLGTRLLALNFIVTGLATLAYALQRNYVQHRAWAIRHVGAGLWVAGQRPFYSLLRFGQFALVGTEAAASDSYLSDAFYFGGYVTTVAYFLGAEWLARRPLAPKDISFKKLAGPESELAMAPPSPDSQRASVGGSVRKGCSEHDCAAAVESLRNRRPLGEGEKPPMPQDGLLGLNGSSGANKAQARDRRDEPERVAAVKPSGLN